jgi:hypothetical protein
LDAFIRNVAGRDDNSSLRLRTVTWNGSVEVITLKLDNQYWPMYELRRTAEGWKRIGPGESAELSPQPVAAERSPVVSRLGRLSEAKRPSQTGIRK